MPIPVEHHTPYSNLPAEQTDRVDGLVSTIDKRFIRSLNPTLGAVNFLVATIFHSIVQECKANGITYYSPDNVAFLHRIIRNRASARLASTGLQQNGSNSPAPLHPESEGTTNVTAYLRQSAPSGIGGRGGADEPSTKKAKRPIKIREESGG